MCFKTKIADISKVYTHSTKDYLTQQNCSFESISINIQCLTPIRFSKSLLTRKNC